MGTPTATPPQTISKRPRIGELLWEPGKSLDLFSMMALIRQCMTTPVVPAEMIAVIFFEETAFNNVRQTTGRDVNKNVVFGKGVGFGQTQIYDPEKHEMFAFHGLNNSRTNNDFGLPTISYDMVTTDNKFSVSITCWYFSWLAAKGQTLDNILGAQTGAGGKGENAARNKLLIPRWKTAAAKLQGLLAGLLPKDAAAKRDEIADAFNSARHPGFEINKKDFADYWRFIIPDAPATP